MLTLFHHPFCPHSRFIRLVLAEYGLEHRTVEERVWERREEFLMLNPAANTPVLVAEGFPPVPGAATIAEFLDETTGAEMQERRLMPVDIGHRVEVRRLAAWFNEKFFAEVSGPLVMERFYKRHMRIEQGGGPPDTDAIRAARINVRYHVAYIGWLVRTRDWLAGDQHELRRSRRGRASVGGGLSGRRAMDRRRGIEELVRAGEVATVVPPAAGRDVAGPRSGDELRRPGLLKSGFLSDPASIKTSLLDVARSHGFDVVGIARPDAAPMAKARLEQFLADGAHGDMIWMETTAERRGDPRALWPDVRSVIMLGLNYGPDHDPLAILDHRDRGAISVYAKGEDYHEVIKPRLKDIARWLVAQAGGDVKVFVDTAAVMEKPLAAAAGLGWQGKHTNLVSREFGSWLFLGAIFTTLELPPDEAEADSCGTCHACLDVCPTAAFPAPYRLDARRCISYLTIEHKGPIPRELRPLMGNRIYGCDDCLAVCPWNKFAQQGHNAKLAARDVARAPALAELSQLDDAAFRTMFAKTAVKRTGRERFIRNVLIAIGNSGDTALTPHAERLLADDFAAGSRCRGVGAWPARPEETGRAGAHARTRERSRRRRGVGHRHGSVISSVPIKL